MEDKRITRRGLLAGLGALVAGFTLHESGLLVPKEEGLSLPEPEPVRRYWQVSRNAPVRWVPEPSRFRMNYLAGTNEWQLTSTNGGIFINGPLTAIYGYVLAR